MRLQLRNFQNARQVHDSQNKKRRPFLPGTYIYELAVANRSDILRYLIDNNYITFAQILEKSPAFVETCISRKYVDLLLYLAKNNAINIRHITKTSINALLTDDSLRVLLNFIDINEVSFD